MVLVGVAVLFLCEKDSSVCVAVCRIQNLRWGLKRLWAGNDCCCKTNRLVSPQLSGFTTGRSSRIFTSCITSPGQTRTASSHMNTLLLNDIRRFSFNITLFSLRGSEPHSALSGSLCAAVAPSVLCAAQLLFTGQRFLEPGETV